MKTFVINLKREKARRKHITEQLAGTNLDWEFADAADYREFSEEEFKTFCDEISLQNDPSMTYPKYCCSYSHIRVYREIVERNLPYALIIEDDAILPADLEDVLAEIETTITQGEVISLFCFGGDGSLEVSSRHTQTLSNGRKIVCPVVLQQARSTEAYIITHDAAKKISKYCFPIYTYADNWDNYQTTNAITSFRCLYPQYFTTAHFRSGITNISRFNDFVFNILNSIGLTKKMLEKRAERMHKDRFALTMTDKPPYKTID